MTAIRDHPERPTPAQSHVLDRLALRTDWQTGCGFASIHQLAADTQYGERTVKNAIAWAIRHNLIVRTRRGHRLGDGTTIASEWRLSLPATSTGTGMHLEDTSTGTGVHLNGHLSASQGARTAPPSRTSSSRTSPSARSRARADGADADAPTDDDSPYAPGAGDQVCFFCGIRNDHDRENCPYADGVDLTNPASIAAAFTRIRADRGQT
jgi:hypothetical protein